MRQGGSWILVYVDEADGKWSVVVKVVEERKCFV